MKKVGVILARFQPIHNGHIALIYKATQENDEVLVIIGSVDKLNARNPIPWNIRKKLVEEALAESFAPELCKENNCEGAFRLCLMKAITTTIGGSISILI